MSQLKQCSRCGEFKERCSDFERWDSVCRGCRKGIDPMRGLPGWQRVHRTDGLERKRALSRRQRFQGAKPIA